MQVIGSAKDWTKLVEELRRQLRPSQRFMLGIVGAPGVGKSTIAQLLAQEIPNSIVVTMDGFHLPNNVLDERGLHHLKGIPATFDAEGFVQLLQEIHQQTNHPVLCPVFDRTIDEPVADVIVVQPAHQLVIIEGNYLLLEKLPWQEIQTLLDVSWYLIADVRLINQRLIERHMEGGRTLSEAQAKIASTDAPNAQLIAQSKPRTDLTIEVRWQIE